MKKSPYSSKFFPCEILVTPRILTSRLDYEALLRRHLNGDWGDLTGEDLSANAHAMEHHEELLSQYPVIIDGKEEVVAIMTENDRSETVVFLLGDTALM